MMNRAEVEAQIRERWSDQAECRPAAGDAACDVACSAALLPEICGHLFLDWGYAFAGLVVEEGEHEWELRYLFHGDVGAGRIQVRVTAPLERTTFPSIVRFVHAANWHEREAEDLFGLVFEGHPHLGDFVLHDDAWQEGVEPMRHGFSAHTPVTDRRPNTAWRPQRILEEPGAFAMPVGPVFGGGAEAAHFLLETVGEDVVRAIPRLFYKYRGIEKLAEGRAANDVLLLAERFSATTAFAHALAFSRAVEAVAGAGVPARAEALRVFLAELERLRHHVGAIASICQSTGLAVGAAQAAMLEEDMLRASGALAGHRYLFGLAVPGGLATDLPEERCRAALAASRVVLEKLERLEGMLRFSSSFLDRLEEVGYIKQRDARVFGLVGPVARASGIARDLRALQPYGAYGRCVFDVATEQEGDGYARLRVLFSECRQAVRLMEQALAQLGAGPVHQPAGARAGTGLGWVEAPRGAAFHWLRLAEDGTVMRYRIVPPSFANWLGFRLGVEDFAFQDFPIILSTLDLSVAENDR